MVRPRRDGRPSAEPDRRKLSNFVVNSLKPRHGLPYAVWDTTVRGFAIVVHGSGRKVWKVVYSRQGRPRWYHIGDASSISLSEAKKMAATILLRVSTGEDPQAERKAARTAGTFSDLADSYRNHSQKKNKSWMQADFLSRNTCCRSGPNYLRPTYPGRTSGPR
jgi:hypothetical protein